MPPSCLTHFMQVLLVHLLPEKIGKEFLHAWQFRRLFSRDHESSEQFAWLNCSHREIETQLACAGAVPSIIVDSSQDETI